MQPSRVWRSTNGSIMPLSSACARIHLSDITAMDLFLTFDVEHADEGEKPACGVEVNLHLRRKRSEEHTSELQSLMRISYAVFCLKKKKKSNKKHTTSLHCEHHTNTRQMYYEHN